MASSKKASGAAASLPCVSVCVRARCAAGESSFEGFRNESAAAVRVPHLFLSKCSRMNHYLLLAAIPLLRRGWGCPDTDKPRPQN